jgi:phospholipase/carboxylesterase
VQLSARPRPTTAPTLTPGTTRLSLANGQPGLLHVPETPVAGLVVALHGAGGHAAGALDLLRADAERSGLVVLAPASRGSTWAGLFGGHDPDTSALDAALADVFAAHPFEPARVAVAGFSDGASYALTLGLANGELFRSVVAFSPGFESAARRRGRPRFFVSHGTGDEVLPIDRTSRRLVPALRGAGYDVTYREFDGGHVVPEQYRTEAAAWVLA